MRRLPYLLCIALFLSGCKSVQVNTQSFDREAETSLISNVSNIVERDSIYIDRFIYEKGDTTYIYKTEYRDRISVKTDTIIVLKDSVVYKEKEVFQDRIEYRIPRWCYWCFAISALVIFVLVKYLSRHGAR